MVRKRNKKSSLLDLPMIGVYAFMIALVILIVYKINDEINTKFQASDDVTAKGKAAMTEVNNLYSGVLDNSFLLLVVGLCIVALALATMVRIHPVFFVFYVILLLIIIFLCAAFSNVYIKMAQQTEMTALAENLTFITHIMGALPWIVGVFGFVLAIVMYKSYQEAQ